MKKTTLLLSAAIVLAACGAQDPAAKFRNALPKTQAVQVGTPQTDPGTGALSVQASALGETTMAQSEFAVMSYHLAVTMNSGVGWILGTVHFVTTFKPTSCGDSACTWGPWVDGDGMNRWKLHVEKAGDAYKWQLSAQNGLDANGQWVDLVAGTAYPVDENRGSGNFTVDFDAQDALNHGSLYQKKDFGQIAVTYDNTKNVSIRANFVNARNQDPDPAKNGHLMKAAYAFDAASSGGELQVAFEDLVTSAVARIRTRWSAGGAGRADVVYDPDGAAGPIAAYLETECWAGRTQDFAEVYDSNPLYGTESACSPFSSRVDPDLALP